MGKTYGVYFSDELDVILRNEIANRQLKQPLLNKKLTVSKLTTAIIYHVVNKNFLKEVVV